MKYLKVRWIHDHSSEPVTLLSELDDERFEVRKVEIFLDGRMGYASGSVSHGGTRLGEVAVPESYEIEKDPQFVVESLGSDEFDRAWSAALSRP